MCQVSTPRIDLDKNSSSIFGDFKVPPKHKMMIPDNQNVQDKNMSPTKIFELVFEKNAMNLLVEESMRYTPSQNAPYFAISQDEIKCLFGFLLVSGYNPHSGKTFYWDLRSDIKNRAICQ